MTSLNIGRLFFYQKCYIFVFCMKHKILYNFASRSRPEKLIACLENITKFSRHSHYQIIVTADIDDDTMTNPAIRDKVISFPNTKILYGTSTGKINAINKNVPLANPDWTILCNHSDDMWFIKEGFDLDIIEAFENYNGLVHFPDQKAGEALITYAMMHRDYYELDHYVYHPAFVSVYADNYQHEVAKKRGKYKFVNKQILEHRHPIWGYGVADDLLKKTEDPVTYNADHVTFSKLIKTL